MRERKFIDAFQIELLTQGASFQYQKDMLERAKKVQFIVEQFAQDLNEWEQAFMVLDVKLKISQKSLISDEIRKADEERDDAYRKYRKGINAFIDFPISDKAEAARILSQHLKDYNIQVTWELTRQTGMISSLLQDLHNKYSNYVKILGMKPVVDLLEDANNRVRNLIQDRNNEKAGRNNGETRTARRDSEQQYRSFVEVLNAYSLINGAAEIGEFIDQQNAEIRRLKLTLPRSSKKRYTATQDNQEENTIPNENEINTEE